jgi:hypothetical protein
MMIGKDGVPSESLFISHHSSFLDVVLNHSIWPECDDYRTIFAPIVENNNISDESDVDVYIDDFVKPISYPICTITKPKKRKKCENSDKMEKMPKRIKHRNIPERTYVKLEKFITEIVHNNELWFQDVFIQNIVLSSNGKSARIEINGSGCTRCVYVNRHHGGNRVYFILSMSGLLTVRCFSKKEDVCKKTPWIQYKVSKSISNDIFGKERAPRFYTSQKSQNAENDGKEDHCAIEQKFDFKQFIARRTSKSFQKTKVSKGKGNCSYMKKLTNMINSDL